MKTVIWTSALLAGLALPALAQEGSPAPSEPGQETPADPGAAPGEPSPAEPSPAEPSPAEPSPAEPSPAEPSPADPSASEGSKAEGSKAEELAKKLQNPVASLVSFPFQGNYDFRIGEEEHGKRFLLNVQPVVPLHLNEDVNLIWRTILPITNQQDVFGDDRTDGALGASRQEGLGDVTLSLFFSPSEPGPGGIIWGVGPAMLFPTASDDLLGTDKWAAGPTAVVLKQAGMFTFGALFSHLWSYAGDDDRDEVNLSFFQPFMGCAFGGGFSLAANFEMSYDWSSSEWTIPFNVSVQQIVPVFGQLVQVFAGPRVYLRTPDHDGPEWGVRFGLVLLFPQ